MPGTERSAAVTWTDTGRVVWTHDPSTAELHRLRAEVDRFADAIIPMLVWVIHDMAGLDLTLLRTYLASERGRLVPPARPAGTSIGTTPGSPT